MVVSPRMRLAMRVAALPIVFLVCLGLGQPAAAYEGARTYRVVYVDPDDMRPLCFKTS